MKQVRNTSQPEPFRNLSNLPRCANQFAAKPQFTSRLQQSRLTLLRPSIKTAFLKSKELEAKERSDSKVTCSPTVAQRRTLKAQQKV